MAQLGRPRSTQTRSGPVSEGSGDRQVIFESFTGGLNNVSDKTSLEDNELSVCDNLEIDSGGGLTSRAPIALVKAPPVAGYRVEHLGYYTNVGGIIFAVVTCEGQGTYLYEPDTAVYTLITTIVGSGCSQFGDKLYICSAATAGGYWDGSTFTVLNSGLYPMPKGEQITLYKSRFWMISRETASNRTRIFFSRITAAGTPPTSINEWNVWDPATGNDFFDVSAGDGQWISCIVAGSYELFIFRNASTYYFKYETSPLTGRLDLLDANIGADNEHSVDRYEFSYVVLNAGRLYRFVSYAFYPLNDPQKLELRPAGGSPSLDVKSAVTIFGRRALVFYGGLMYALDMVGGTWSTWTSASVFGYGMRMPRTENDLTPSTVFGVSASTTTGLWGIYRIVDTVSTISADAEEMVCTIETRAHDFEVPDHWKRMWYWSADVLTARDVQGVALPLQLDAILVSWDDLEAGTWDDLEAGTWDAPLTASASVTTDREIPGSAPGRLVVTFSRDMRFKRCSFRVVFTTNGTSGTAPVRLVSISVNAVTKQRLPQVVQ